MPFMQLQLKNKIHFPVSIAFSLITVHALANEIPECPKTINVENGKVIDAKGWDYSFAINFINRTDKKITMKDGTLTSDYRLPEITEINVSTNSVTGGLSYDEIEETDTFLSLTWDIESIYKNSTAVFVCDFHGDREKERPIRTVYLHKAIPKTLKTCTVIYKMREHERIPESQQLICK